MEDVSAFDAWYRQRHARVVGLLTAYCGDADAAADATNEAFARALADWRRVRGMASRDGWVYTVALNALRRSMRRRNVEGRLVATGAGVDGPAVAPELAGEDAEVWAAVRRLPPRQRQAVLLRYVGDLPEADVAAAMGVTRGTVARALSDARASLARHLVDEGSDLR